LRRKKQKSNNNSLNSLVFLSRVTFLPPMNGTVASPPQGYHSEALLEERVLRTQQKDYAKAWSDSASYILTITMSPHYMTNTAEKARQ